MALRSPRIVSSGGDLVRRIEVRQPDADAIYDTAESFRTLLVRAELPTIRCHDLRHSAATLLLSLGEQPKVVPERLGHSAIGVMMNAYSHVLPNMQRRAANKLDALFADAKVG